MKHSQAGNTLKATTINTQKYGDEVIKEARKASIPENQRRLSNKNHSPKHRNKTIAISSIQNLFFLCIGYAKPSKNKGVAKIIHSLSHSFLSNNLLFTEEGFWS